MIALAYMGTDSCEHIVMFDDHAELITIRMAFESARIEITRVWCVE